MKKSITTDSFKSTQSLGSDFAKKLKGGEVIALYGDLGSGKTTFMQGLAKGLGVAGNIISPTFIIMRTYRIGKEHLYHVDLYRIGNEQEVEDLGLLELIEDANDIVVIEWPDKIENLLPKKTIRIYFEYIKDDKRKITFA